MIFSRFFHRHRRNRDLGREIAAHLNEERAENIARGLSPEEADRIARIKFGSARRVHEDLWQENTLAPFENLVKKGVTEGAVKKAVSQGMAAKKPVGKAAAADAQEAKTA
jgi:hypothetical protein